jgi:hypothetical protein
MDNELLAEAYRIGREEYRAARLSAFSKLRERSSESDFDEVHAASERGMKLYEVAFELCRKIHQRAHTAEAAHKLLRKRCPGFSEQVYQQAFYDAFIENRYLIFANCKLTHRCSRPVAASPTPHDSQPNTQPCQCASDAQFAPLTTPRVGCSLCWCKWC